MGPGFVNVDRPQACAEMETQYPIHHLGRAWHHRGNRRPIVEALLGVLCPGLALRIPDLVQTGDVDV
jgi:hypothetical protein